MIAVLKQGTEEKQMQNLIEWFKSQGLDVHVSRGEYSTILGLIGLLFLMRSELAQLFEIFSLELLLAVIGIVLAAGVLICMLSTYFVVNKLVSLNKDDLYY